MQPHCHAVAPGGAEVSIDLKTFEVLSCSGFSKADVVRIIEEVKKYRNELLQKWEEYHG